MSINDILGGGGLLIVLLTLIEVAPIKINPWTILRETLQKTTRAFGRAINGDVLARLDELQKEQSETRKALDQHIKTDDESKADEWRAYILRFNDELLQGLRHSEEGFIEALGYIDKYESYCREHPDYPNSRAVHAIANIGRVYDGRLRKHDFYAYKKEEE